MGRLSERGVALFLVTVLAVTACADGSSDADPESTPQSPTRSATVSTPPDGPGSANLGVPTSAELRAGTEWEGEFTIAIEVWDYCATSGELTRSQSYTKTEAFSFSTAEPVDYGPAARETNPFFVSAGTDPDVGGPVGLALQSTGVVALPGEESEPYILQFWRIAYDDGHLTGELVEDGREMGLALNGFQDNDTLVVCQPHQGMIVRPYRMKEGSSIEAELTAESVSVVMVGRSHDEMRRWRVEATASRVG